MGGWVGGWVGRSREKRRRRWFERAAAVYDELSGWVGKYLIGLPMEERRAQHRIRYPPIVREEDETRRVFIQPAHGEDPQGVGEG